MVFNDDVAGFADQIPTGIDPYVAVTFDDVRFLCLLLMSLCLILINIVVERKFVCLSYRTSFQNLPLWMLSESLHRVLSHYLPYMYASLNLVTSFL